MKKFRLILMLFILPVCALAQGAQYTGIAQTSRNMIGMGNVYVPIPGASVNVCTGVYTGTACPSGGDVTVYSDQSLATTLTQPITADNWGNFSFWAAPGAYYFTVTGQGAASSSYQLTLPFGISGTYNATAKSIEQVRYADQWCTTQGTLDESCFDNAEDTLGASGGKIIFGAGETFHTTHWLQINSNVTLQCDAGATIDFEPTGTISYSNSNDRAVEMQSALGANEPIASAIAKGATSFTASSAPSGLTAGEWLLIVEIDPAVGDAEYFDWVQVASVSSATVNVVSPFRLAFPDASGHTLTYQPVTGLVSNPAVIGCNIESSQSATGTPGISVGQVRGAIIENNHVDMANGQPLYSYRSQGTRFVNNWTSTGGAVTSEFAESVDMSIIGNSFGNDYTANAPNLTPQTAPVTLDFGMGFFTFTGNTIRDAGNIALEAVDHPHDGVIANNTFPYTYGASVGQGISGSGATNLVIEGNRLPGGSGATNQGIVLQDCSTCSPAITSSGNTVSGNIVSGYHYDYGSAQNTGDSFSSAGPSGGWNLLGNVQLGVESGGYFGDQSAPDPFDLYCDSGIKCVDMATDGSLRVANWVTVGNVGATPGAPLAVYFDSGAAGNASNGVAISDTNASNPRTWLLGPNVGGGVGSFNFYDNGSATIALKILNGGGISTSSAAFSGPVALNGGGSIASGKTLTNNGTILNGTVNATTLQQGGSAVALASQLPLSGSIAGPTTSLAANTCGDVVTQTVTGATTTMTPIVTVDGALPTSGLVIQSAVTAANTVSIEYCNVTTAPITPAAATLEIRVVP